MRAGGLWALALMAALPAHGNVTNAIWQARLKGRMVIQRFTSQVEPATQQATFKEGDFLRMVLNRDPDRSDVLAFNIDMVGGRTNFYLSVFNTAARQNSQRLSVFETTTLVADGQRLTFTMEAPLSQTGIHWAGGYLRISGTGRFANGVPTRIRGRVTGLAVDTRPGDLRGTTGLVTRASITTGRAPLRILPPTP